MGASCRDPRVPVATVWVPAVESRGCQSLLRSSHIRSVGASRYYVAPSAPPGYRDTVFQTGMEWLFFIFTYKIIYGAFIMK